MQCNIFHYTLSTIRLSTYVTYMYIVYYHGEYDLELDTYV